MPLFMDSIGLEPPCSHDDADVNISDDGNHESNEDTINESDDMWHQELLPHNLLSDQDDPPPSRIDIYIAG